MENELARVLLDKSDDRPLRLVYGTASADNTVAVRGAATAVALPAIIPVKSGDYCAVLESGADRVIVGPVGADWETFTPTWSGITVGNATQAAEFRYVPGGIEVFGYLTLGSTSSISGPLVLTLPDGVTIRSNARHAGMAFGDCTFVDFGTATYGGVVLYDTATTVGLRPWNVAGTYSSRVSTSSSIPFTWVSGDAFTYRFFVPTT